MLTVYPILYINMYNVYMYTKWPAPINIYKYSARLIFCQYSGFPAKFLTIKNMIIK